MTKSDRPAFPPSRNSLKKRIIQRVIVALLLSGGIIFCQEMGWLDQLTDQFVRQKIDWSNNQSVIKYLKQIITDKNLTEIPLRCLIPVINNDDGSTILNVEIHEKHNQECLNTRKNFPTIFTFRVNRQNGSIQIDKNTPNHFYPLH